MKTPSTAAPSRLLIRASFRLAGVAFLLGLLATAAPTAVWAQTGVTATISGTVTDQTGAALPGATVLVVNVETNQIRKITSLDNGTYAVPQLQSGK